MCKAICPSFFEGGIMKWTLKRGYKGQTIAMEFNSAKPFAFDQSSRDEVFEKTKACADEVNVGTASLLISPFRGTIRGCINHVNCFLSFKIWSSTNQDCIILAFPTYPPPYIALAPHVGLYLVSIDSQPLHTCCSFPCCSFPRVAGCVISRESVFIFSSRWFRWFCEAISLYRRRRSGHIFGVYVALCLSSPWPSCYVSVFMTLGRPWAPWEALSHFLISPYSVLILTSSSDVTCLSQCFPLAVLFLKAL